MPDFKKALRDLQIELANGRMSVIVGSGFSKNVDPVFLDWKQLLMELVFELHEEKISALLPNKHTSDQRYDILIKETEIQIKQKGYLGVVSEYISRKGYEEAMVVYIEKYTPIIFWTDKKYYLIKNGIREPLEAKTLRLHKALLGLPWNNVYTTNYDPLLEASTDMTIHQQLIDEIEQIDKEIADTDKQMTDLVVELQGLQEEITQIETEIRAYQRGALITNEDFDIEEKTKKIDLLTTRNDNLHETQYKLEGDRESLQKKRQSKETTLNDTYTLIKDARDLRIKKNKNIIKLHGSLRTQQERLDGNYGFDRDPGKQYVISSEHYENYPSKHEAFTQLMRLSLLQESFCLIGFSGDDPNFTSWISWIRDLLYQGTIGKKEPRFKIYLIDVRPEGTKDDRLLFFQNHSIIRIPLTSCEVIEFLQHETNQTLDHANKFGSALQMLFQFLSKNDYMVSPVVPKDPSIGARWRTLWDNLITYDKGIQIKTEEIDNTIEAIAPLFKTVSIADLGQWETFSQFRFLNVLNGQGGKLDGVEQPKINYLIQVCASTLLAPTHFLWNFILNDKIDPDLSVIIERDKTIANPLSQSRNEDPYNEILRLAFSFRYKDLGIALEAWQPPVDQVHLKSGFLATFSAAKAQGLLMKQISSDSISEQQRMLSYEILNFVTRSTSFSAERHRVRDRIKEYQRSGYISAVSRLQDLGKTVAVHLEKVIPYGKDRFSISTVLNGKMFTDAKEPLEYLMLLIRSGLPTALNYSQIIASDEFYNLYNIAFELAPFPFIYYCLEYTKNDVIIRMGQDVAYSAKLNSTRPSILLALLKANYEIHENRRSSLLAFSSQLFISVRPIMWQQEFHSIWERAIKSMALFSERPSAMVDFAKIALRFVEDKEMICALILELLPFLQTHSKDVISYLFHLNNNHIFSNIKPSDSTDSLGEVLNNLIDDLPNNTENNIFVLGNLHRFLSPQQLDRVHESLLISTLDEIDSAAAFRILLFFSKGDRIIHSRLIPKILKHRSLWATGITGNNMTMGVQMLDLLSLTDKGNPRIGLHLSPEDIREAYNKLRPSLDAIRAVWEKGNADLNFTSMVEPIYLFLTAYRELSDDLPDFTPTETIAKEMFNRDKGYGDLFDGLNQSDKTVVLWALAELSSDIEKGEFPSDLVQSLLFKLLLQSEPALEATLNYVATWIDDEKNHQLFLPFSKTLIKILEKYEKNPIPGETPFIEEMLVRIAYALQKMGINDPAVTQWLSYALQCQFNNVRQWYELKTAAT